MRRRVSKKYNAKNSVLLILLLAVFLILSTYAWFTANRLVRVSSLDVEIHASEGFQISLDAINWKSVITANEITGGLISSTYSAHKNRLPSSMDPVSTATNTNAAGHMEMFKGEVDTNDKGEYVITAEAFDESVSGGAMGGSFIAFDLFFRTNNDMNLYLEENAGVLDNAPLASNRRGRGIENGTRVAFVQLGNIPASSPLTGNALSSAAQALKDGASGTGDNVVIWEPNYLSHTDEAKNEIFNRHGIEFTDAIWTSAIVYDGIFAAIPESAELLLTETNQTDNPTFFKEVPNSRFVRTEKDASNGTIDKEADLGIKLNAGITKLRIYMWIEGQDYDTVDSASGSDMRWDLILTART